MGVIWFVAVIGHILIFSVPAAIAATVIGIARRTSRRFWLSAAVTAVAVFGLRLAVYLVPVLLNGEVYIWRFYLSLLFGWPLFISLTPLIITIPLLIRSYRLKKAADTLWGMTAGLCLSVVLHSLVAILLVEFLCKVLGIEITH